MKGCQRSVIYLKNTGSDLFDEAYLILRRGARTNTATPREIELEALRILRGSDKRESTPKKHENLKAFLAGAALSATVIGAVSVLLWLLF